MNTPILEPSWRSEPLQRCFVLATHGDDPGLDSLGILIAVLKELDPDERAACLAYITSRFMGETS